MSGTLLKVIAVVSMVIDHLAVSLRLSGILQNGTLYEYMRIAGRLAFPVYGFLLAEGALHTKCRWKYLLRLFAFALISELPYDLALRGPLFVWNHQNVFFTLVLGLIVMYVIMWGSRLEGAKKIGGLGLAAVLAAVFAYTSEHYLYFDYGDAGVIMLTVIGLLTVPAEDLRKHVPLDRTMRCMIVAAAVILMLPFTSDTEIYGLLSLIPIGLYNGKRGKTGKAMKYAFYMVYPLHLLLLWLLIVLPVNGFMI